MLRDGADAPSEDGADSERRSPGPASLASPPQKWVRKKHYKIQEVIKRRQIILVQVVKEERGNKGAALLPPICRWRAVIAY